jgi:hypothetical protein
MPLEVAARGGGRRQLAWHLVALWAAPARAGQPKGQPRPALGPAGHAGLRMRAAGRLPAGATWATCYQQGPMLCCPVGVLSPLC